MLRALSFRTVGSALSFLEAQLTFLTRTESRSRHPSARDQAHGGGRSLDPRSVLSSFLTSPRQLTRTQPTPTSATPPSRRTNSTLPSIPPPLPPPTHPTRAPKRPLASPSRPSSSASTSLGTRPRREERTEGRRIGFGRGRGTTGRGCSWRERVGRLQV